MTRLRRLLAWLRLHPLRSLLLALLLVVLGVGGSWAGQHFYVDYHHREAELASARYDFEAAQRHLRACLALRPRSIELNFEMARASRRANHEDQAERYLHKCQELQGKNKNPEHSLEAILLRVQWKGEIAEVERLLQKEVDEASPDADLILEALAKGYVRNYRHDAAMYCLQRLLEQEPDHVVALLLRASLWKTAGNHAKAEEDYRRAVEAQPEHRAARLQLGQQLLLMKRAQEALEQFEYLRQRPNGDAVDVLLGLARSHRQLGHAETARQLLDEVLARDPHEGFALVERGKIALEIESAAAAEKWLRQAVADYPYDAQGNYLLAQALQKQGKEEEARRYEVERRRIESDWKALEKAFQRVVKNPRDPEPRLEAGRICLRNGRADEAERWLHSALEQDPKHVPTKAALAELRARLGNNDNATK